MLRSAAIATLRRSGVQRPSCVCTALCPNPTTSLVCSGYVATSPSSTLSCSADITATAKALREIHSTSLPLHRAERSKQTTRRQPAESDCDRAIGVPRGTLEAAPPRVARRERSSRPRGHLDQPDAVGGPPRLRDTPGTRPISSARLDEQATGVQPGTPPLPGSHVARRLPTVAATSKQTHGLFTTSGWLCHTENGRSPTRYRRPAVVLGPIAETSGDIH
jgi:hypothetical protein